MNSYGGLQAPSGSTALNCPNAGVELKLSNVPTMEVIDASQHGDGAISASATTGRLTLSPGAYFVSGNISLEGEYTSGTSGDALGDITATIYKGGSATDFKAIANTVAEGQKRSMAVQGIVEVAQSAQDADTPTNYVSLYLKGGDANGNDVIVREFSLLAVRLK